MPNSIQPSAHDEAEELLPWYATGQLDAADRAQVERHLISCADCRRELAVERRMIEEFKALAPEVDSSWERLRAQIEPRRRAPRRRLAEVAAELWGVLSRPAVAALAVAQLAVLAFAAWLVPLVNQPAYRALGSSPAPQAANMLVIFRPDATEEDIRTALRASSASLVGGPTSAGAYLLHVRADGRPAALTKLQSNENIEMAQPIDGPTQ